MDFLNQIFQRFALIRFRRFLGSLFYPLRRDWLERQSSSPPPSELPQVPGELIQAQVTGRGATFTFAAADLEIEFLTSDLVRLYSDAGDGYGDWRLEQFDLSRDEHNLEITWSDQGDYAFPYGGVSICLHGFESEQALVDGTPMPVKENRLEVGRFQTAQFQRS